VPTKNKSLSGIKTIILAICLILSGWLALKPKIVGIRLPPAQVLPILPNLTVKEKPVETTTPATAAIPTVYLSSSRLAQGDTLLIRIENAKTLEEISGQFDSKKINFFKADGKIFSLVGMGVKMLPGVHRLNFILSDNLKIEKQIEVISGDFKVGTLAFTPELEAKGYNATSVVQTIAVNDGAKIYQAMEKTSPTAYFDQSFADPLSKMTNVGIFGSIRKSGSNILRHLGVDLDAKMDTPVYAVNDGVVCGTLELIDYGNTVVIDHGLGIFSLYLHLDKFKTILGQKVKKGQIIGLSGNTGYSISPHLHFSIRINGTSVDPLKFIETARF
jgi:murein DD-endopeptidase MepM/ murein hydrolase activator NlpD